VGGDTFTAQDLLPTEFAARLDAIDVISRRVLAGKLQGERRSKRRGRSVEFDDYRPYVAGDDLRHIDWNVFARLDRFVLKLFQEEEDLSVRVVLDVSSSMLAGEPAKIVTASRLAAALSYVALVNNNRLELAAIGSVAPEALATGLSVAASGGGGSVVRVEALRGRRSTARAMEAIASLVDASARASQTGPVGAMDFSAACRLAIGHSSGKGIVILLSDLLVPGVEEGLKVFAAGLGHDALVVQTLSPGELDPARETLGSSARAAISGDLRLIDSETGAGREITVTPALLAAYRRRAQEYIQQCAEACARRGIRHALLTSDADVPQFVLNILRRRGLVG
jgi:uncharacterized protein (DUF58 family)